MFRLVPRRYAWQHPVPRRSEEHDQDSSKEEAPAVEDGTHADEDKRVQIGPLDI